MLSLWSSAVRALVWLILAVLALLWSLSATSVSVFVTVTTVVVKSCGHVVLYVIKGGF